MHVCYVLKYCFIRNKVFLRGYATLFLSETQCFAPIEKVVCFVKLKNKFQFLLTFCRFCCIFKIKEWK